MCSVGPGPSARRFWTVASFLMFAISLQIRATTCISVLRVRRQARAVRIDNVKIFPVCDDVSVTRLKGLHLSIDVRNGALAGTILGMTIYFILCHIVLRFSFPQVFKVISAASKASWSSDTVLKLGQVVTGTIAEFKHTRPLPHSRTLRILRYTPQNNRNWLRPSQRTCQ